MTVGSFDFAESELLGEIFVQALVAEGVKAEHRPRIGSREVVEPALEQGLIDVVPEYLASATQFLTLGQRPVDRAVVVHERLREVGAPRGLTALAASTAVNRNAIAMRRDTAARLGIATVDDLKRFPDLHFVGPPECPERPACLPLLNSLGVTFETFTPLPLGRPIALALAAGEVDVGLMFSSDPLVERHGLILLDGSVGFDRAEQLVPLVRTEVVERHGDRFVAAIEGVMARLTTAEPHGTQRARRRRRPGGRGRRSVGEGVSHRCRVRGC